MNGLQKQLVKEIFTELELGGNLIVFKEQVCELFSEMKEEFSLMCDLYDKFQIKFEDLFEKE
jgi:hypothetical protein